MTLELGTTRSRSSESPGRSPARPEKRPRLDKVAQQNEVTIENEPMAIEEEDASDSKPSEVKQKSSRKPKNRKRKQKHPVIEPYSPDDVLWHDVVSLLGGKDVVDKVVEAGKDWDAPLQFGTEIELLVSELSSSGESLSMLPPPHPPWSVAVPFALPGERIRARIYRNARLVSMADLLSIEAPNEKLRDMDRVKCKYFGKCAGCQYQMLSYTDQLEFKRKVVDKAYRNFSSLSPDSVPAALPTIASPSAYGYRTKITPHFDVPHKKAKDGKDGPKREWGLRIGFAEKGRRSVMDIEECPIATPVLNEALGPARKGVQETINTYKRGATLLLRDSLIVPATERPVDGVDPNLDVAIADPTVDALTSSFEQHVCITDHKAIVRERVGSFLFEFPAGSFFQNNNSVLEPLASYVRDAVLGGSSAAPPTHLVDAYCGSGLFAISLSPHFSHVAGVEISADSIRYARHNASLNDVPSGKCAFHVGQAEAIFDSVKDFPPAQTVIVVDPPRKGCDTVFMDQLIAFGPATVVYVSCNVHTQARDVGMMLKKSQGAPGGYKLESLRGFDLFPQTAHVESVAVLRRV